MDTTSRFLSLPRELRDMIYRYALHQPDGLIVGHIIAYPDLTVLGSSGRPIWYGYGRKHTKSFPTTVLGRPRVSRFYRDRKGERSNPVALLRTCKKVRAEAEPLFYPVNDVVIAVFGDDRAPYPSGIRRLPMTERALNPVSKLLWDWLEQERKAPLSVTLEVQEVPSTDGCWSRTSLANNLFSWLIRMAKMSRLSGFNFRLSIPLVAAAPERVTWRSESSGTTTTTLLDWRVVIDIRCGRRDLQERLDQYMRLLSLITPQSGDVPSRLYGAEDSLRSWMQLFPA